MRLTQGFLTKSTTLSLQFQFIFGLEMSLWGIPIPDCCQMDLGSLKLRFSPHVCRVFEISQIIKNRNKSRNSCSEAPHSGYCTVFGERKRDVTVASGEVFTDRNEMADMIQPGGSENILTGSTVLFLQTTCLDLKLRAGGSRGIIIKPGRIDTPN